MECCKCAERHIWGTTEEGQSGKQPQCYVDGQLALLQHWPVVSIFRMGEGKEQEEQE